MTRNGTLVGGLGGAAVFGENALALQDDSPSATVDRTDRVRGWFDLLQPRSVHQRVRQQQRQRHVQQAHEHLHATVQRFDRNPIIAPFFADVDTRPAEDGGAPGGTVAWDLDTTRHSSTVTWSEVGYFAQHSDLTNAFHL